MADVGFRDLEGFLSGPRGSEPVAPPLPSPKASPVTADPAAPSVIITPPPSGRAIFGGDAPTGADTLGIDAPVTLLAELAAHRGTAAPLGIGLLGGPGSGKSFALGRLTERLREIAIASGREARGPFLQRVHIQQVDAATLDGDPALALAAQVHAGLRQPYPALAREIAHTARDPHVVLRETGERLDEARRRLDSERRTLEESGSRMARLTETVLYEAAGSQVDSYARANRARIENRLTGFGITGDPIRNFKDIVRVVTESGGPVSLVFNALHGYKGQTRLIVLAVLFALIGFGLGVAIDTQDTWITDLHTGPQVVGTTATWLSAHMDLLALARKAAYGLALLAIAVNLFRAFGFARPILTGARLLRDDLENRRRDLGGHFAHQTKRVDVLASDVERLTRAVNEAEKRVGGTGVDAGSSEPSPFEAGARTQAHSFFAALRSLHVPEAQAPQRIVIALDHLDAIAPERARLILDTLHRIATEGGIVTCVALDPSRLGVGLAELERWVQVPLRLDAKPGSRDYAGLVAQMLGQGAAPVRPPQADVSRSALDEPVSEQEAALLASLAPVAGRSPRAIKRFVNLYTLARLGGDEHRGALALMLALDQGGTPAERQAVEDAMKTGDLDAPLGAAGVTPRLRAALAAVEALDGRLTKADVARAAAHATSFSVAAFV